MGFIKKLVLYSCAVLLPAALAGVPGNLRHLFVQGREQNLFKLVAYPDSLKNFLPPVSITSDTHSQQDLVKATELLIAALDFAQSYSEEDASKRAAFIEQEIARVSWQQMTIACTDVASQLTLPTKIKEIFLDLGHVLCWKSLYKASLQGEIVPKHRGVESINASGLNLSTINFRVLRSIFPNLKKINLSNNQITQIEDSQLPYIRNLEINLRGNPLQKVSYGFFNAGSTIEMDEAAPVYASPQFSALYARVRIMHDISGFPLWLARSLFSPLVARDNKQSLIGSLVSCIAPDFARDSIKQYWHDCVYRSAIGSVIPRAASFTVQLARPWFYYPLHDAMSSLLARYNLGTSTVGKILYPLGLTAVCGRLNRYASQIPGADEITATWDMAHDFLARHVPFKAQVIGAIGLIAVTGVADYIHTKTTPATIKVHRAA